MTPTELKETRLRLGLGTPGLGKALETDARTVRRWEEGKHPIPGPVAVAVRLLLERHVACELSHNGTG